MNDDVKTIIAWTFGIIALAWVLMRAADVGTVTQALSSGYATGVGAILPKAA